MECSPSGKSKLKSHLVVVVGELNGVSNICCCCRHIVILKAIMKQEPRARVHNLTPGQIIRVHIIKGAASVI